MRMMSRNSCSCQYVHALMLRILISIILCTGLPAAYGQSIWHYSRNLSDYSFGWIVNGTHSNGSVPICNYCVNIDVSYTENFKTLRFPNRNLNMYRCDGVEQNEQFAYHQPTNAIVFSNFTWGVLCVDADAKSLTKVVNVTLQLCNSTKPSQRWKWRGNSLTQERNGRTSMLVGSLPSPRAALSQDYYFPLTLNDSSTYIPQDGSKTATFTFLPQNTLVDSTMKRFTTKGLLAINGGRLLNGDFERSTIQAGASLSWSDYDQNVPSYLSVCGWVIEAGPIDYVKAGAVAPYHGQYSIHLNTFTHQPFSGAISQTVETEPRKDYSLSFYMSGFPPKISVGDNQNAVDQVRKNWACAPNYTHADLEVQIHDETGRVEFRRNFSTDVLDTVSYFVPWTLHTISFRPSTNVTKILFKSMTLNNSCGPMIDDVRFFRPGPPDRALLWSLVGGIGGTLLILGFLVGLVGFFVRRRYKRTKREYADLLKNEYAKVYTVKQLSMATDKFRTVLGEGAYGTVYKAVFPDGTIRAVKMEKSKSLNLSPEAAARASEEIALLLRIHHRNLVNLTGFCINKGRQTLVFEYLSNGSLHDRLHKSVLDIPSSKSKDSRENSVRVGDSVRIGESVRLGDSVDLSQLYAQVLPWTTRVKIACEVAYGLEYLHHDADPPIVHRDVKSHNILLTSSDSAKLADFGFSKAAPEQTAAFQSVETLVRGSFGYMDPHYFATGVVSTKSDVYSYGVVLLELITGHQAIHHATSLVFWAAPHLGHPSCYHHLADSNLRGRYDKAELESLVELTKMCVMDNIKERPTMRQVVSYLNSKNLVAISGNSFEQVPKSDGTIEWEDYHKARSRAQEDHQSPPGSSESNRMANQLD